MRVMPYRSSSGRPPRSSAEITVICEGLMATWRRISGITPWPIEPKPIITMRPPNATSCFDLRGAAIEISRYGNGRGTLKRRRGLFQGPVVIDRAGYVLDAVGLQGREAVE